MQPFDKALVSVSSRRNLVAQKSSVDFSHFVSLLEIVPELHPCCPDDQGHKGENPAIMVL